MGNVLGFDLVSTVLITAIINCLHLQEKKKAISCRNEPSPPLVVIKLKPPPWEEHLCSLPSPAAPAPFRKAPRAAQQLSQRHFSAVPPISWATSTTSDAENIHNEKGFLSPGQARSRVRAFRSHSHLIFWITNTGDFPSQCLSFPSPQGAQHIQIPWMHTLRASQLC